MEDQYGGSSQGGQDRNEQTHCIQQAVNLLKKNFIKKKSFSPPTSSANIIQSSKGFSVQYYHMYKANLVDSEGSSDSMGSGE